MKEERVVGLFEKVSLIARFLKNKYNPYSWILGRPQIGKNVWIGAFTVIDGSGGLKIGNGVTVSCGVHIYTHSVVKRSISERSYNNIDRSPVEIEEYVHIGPNVVILMGAKIGHHSIIGAGAVVLTGTVVPPYSILVGVPAKVVKRVPEDFVPKRLLQDYMKL
jgi:acetyltransferase-like isoleucine patch superfamily enzyme